MYGLPRKLQYFNDLTRQRDQNILPIMQQSTLSDLTYYSAPPKGGKKPTSIVIMVHGYGANGQDLIGIAPEWCGALPETLLISPDAPTPCDQSPLGRQWFSLLNYTPQGMLNGIKDAWSALDKFIDAVIKEHNIPSDKIALMGFSQGTMMSLHTMMKRTDKLAGVLGYSGRLTDHDLAHTTANKDVPIHLIHGTDDPVIPVSEFDIAIKTLTNNNFPISGEKTLGLAHGIDHNGIIVGGRILKEWLST